MMLQSTLTLITVALLGGCLAQYPVYDRYSTPLYCQYGTSYAVADRATYTPRSDTECCYMANTRNICCYDFQYVNGAQQYACKCSPTITCGLVPDTTTTTTTSTTAPPTTTTTTTTTTSTESPTTTTTTTEPPTTTTEETTTTMMETTTETFMSLCGAKSRVLNGQPADECDNLGMANITLKTPDQSHISVCNAVFTLATVNGKVEETFLTTQFCTDIINTLSPTHEMHLRIGIQTYPFMPVLMSTVPSSDGAAFIDIADPFRNILIELGCQQPICAYDPDTMSLDFHDCKVVSYGAYESTTLSSNGLNEVAIKEDTTPTGCADVPEMFGATNTRCFTTVSGQNVDCSRDSGAMVVCKAPVNGEWILVGVKSQNTDCDKTPNLRVINYPG